MKNFLKQNWLLIVILLIQFVAIIKINSLESRIEELSDAVGDIDRTISSIESENSDIINKLDNVESAIYDLE